MGMLSATLATSDGSPSSLIFRSTWISSSDSNDSSSRLRRRIFAAGGPVPPPKASLHQSASPNLHNHGDLFLLPCTIAPFHRRRPGFSDFEPLRTSQHLRFSRKWREDRSLFTYVGTGHLLPTGTDGDSQGTYATCGIYMLCSPYLGHTRFIPSTFLSDFRAGEQPLQVSSSDSQSLHRPCQKGNSS